MQAGQPSETALRVAAHRAAHQIVENGEVFADPYAEAVLGPDAAALIAAAVADQSMRPMRLMFAARSRFADDCLRDAVARGVRQIVILGSGLDTFALRNPYQSHGVQVFEVDHPSTQQWKQERLRQAGLPVPAATHYAPLDFERDTLGSVLAAAGLDDRRPAFFQWLGVVMYLGKEAVFKVLSFIAELPQAELVLDYTEPLENYPPNRQAFMRKVARRAAEAGEEWLTFLDPTEISKKLSMLGFHDQEDLGLADIQARYAFEKDRAQTRDAAGPHILRARNGTDQSQCK